MFDKSSDNAGSIVDAGMRERGRAGVDPHQAAADWFDANREYVAGSVLTAALAYSPALAAVDVDINYLEKQYQSGVRTELRDVERVEAQDGPCSLPVCGRWRSLRSTPTALAEWSKSTSHGS